MAVRWTQQEVYAVLYETCKALGIPGPTEPEREGALYLQHMGEHQWIIFQRHQNGPRTNSQFMSGTLRQLGEELRAARTLAEHAQRLKRQADEALPPDNLLVLKMLVTYHEDDATAVEGVAERMPRHFDESGVLALDYRYYVDTTTQEDRDALDVMRAMHADN